MGVKIVMTWMQPLHRPAFRRPDGPTVTLQASSLRRREVILSRIAIYIAFVFLFCHSVRVVPNAYELYTTYTKVTTTPVLQELHTSPKSVPELTSSRITRLDKFIMSEDMYRVTTLDSTPDMERN